MLDIPSVLTRTRTLLGRAITGSASPPRSSELPRPLNRSTAAGAVAVACLAWSHELVLARLTFDRQDLLDVGVSALGWLLVMGTWWVAHTAVPKSRRDYYSGVVLCLPLGAVLGRLAAAPAFGRDADLGMTIQIGCLLLALVVGLALGRMGRSAPPSWLVTLGFVVAAAVGAGLRSGGEALSQGDGAMFVGVATSLPPADVVFMVLAGWLCALAVASQRWGPLAVLLGTVALAVTPRPPPVPEWSVAGDAPSAPDIVLLSVDTLRADRGSGFMASADALAADGVTFSAAWSPAPWTLPSMATLHTGVGPELHGAYRGPTGSFAPIRSDIPTLAEALSASGYDTAAVLAPNAFVGSGFGFDRGFAHFEHAMEGAGYALPLSVRDVLARPMIPDALTSLGLLGRRSYAPAGQLAERAAAVSAARRSRPLFLWVHFLDCHFPYRGAPGAPVSWSTAMALSGGDPEPVQGWLPTDEVIAAYDHEVHGVDAAITELLAALGPAPRQGRIVVLTSDHGEEFEDHGGFWHGHALWEELVHVPLIIQGLPGTRAGQVVTTPVGLADVTATLARAAGVPWSTGGRDLARPVPPRVMRTWNLLYGPPMSQAVRDGNLKIIGVEGRPPMAFDLATDPGERSDVSATVASRIERLLLPLDVVEQEAREMSASERQMLEVLGYAEEQPE
ncbi:MAG: arylsulfatase A-like enzyme [Myxococcota bacterium]|jgi:arylsulfatase A-like enzyme